MSKKSFLKGTIFGALFGSLLALFLSPKSGKKLKDDIKNVTLSFSQKLAKEKKLTKEKYHRIVDKIIEGFIKEKRIAKEGAKKIAADLKKRWREIQKEIRK